MTKYKKNEQNQEIIILIKKNIDTCIYTYVETGCQNKILRHLYLKRHVRGCE